MWGLTVLTAAGGSTGKSPEATMPEARTDRIPTCSGTLKLPFYSDLRLIRSDLPILWGTAYLIKVLFKNCFY